MKKVKRYTWELVLALALLAGLIAGAAGQPGDAWHDKLIRLHVVANSDSEADQAQKLRVRDAVLAAAEPLLAGVDNAAAARQTLQAHLPQLEQAASGVLEGSGYTAAVTLRREAFPLREYDSFTLPAGEYEALRVTIGAGEGHNWWCVVYPSICFTASAEELTEIAVSAGLTEDEAAQLTGQSEGYVFRVQIVELAQKLWRWLSGRFSPAGR